MKRPAIFFDRDNTLIITEGYLGDPNQVVLVPGAADAVARARQMGFMTVVVSNQSGVARGMFTENDVWAVNRRMNDMLVAENAEAVIDWHEFCPFHAEAVIDAYRADSDLRKPKPGMIYRAADSLNIDLSSSWMVGDAARDIEAGNAAGCRTILCQDPDLSPSVASAVQPHVRPTMAVCDLSEAFDFIASHLTPAPVEPTGILESIPTVQTAAPVIETPAQGNLFGEPAPVTTPVAPVVETEKTNAAEAGVAAPEVRGQRASDQPNLPQASAPTPAPASTPLPAQTPASMPLPASMPVPVQTPLPASIPVPVQTPVPASMPLPTPMSAQAPVSTPAQTFVPAQVAPPAPAGKEPTVRIELGKLESLAGQILQEVRRSHEAPPSDFSVSKLLGGIVQVVSLAVLILAYLNRNVPGSLEPTLLLALVLQTLTISLLIMGRQR